MVEEVPLALRFAFPPSSSKAALRFSSLLDVVHTARESELQVLWEEEDYSELKTRLEEMKGREMVEQQKLAEDLKFCEENIAESRKSGFQ